MFKDLTIGQQTEDKENVVVMGRKTWDSIKKFAKNGKPPLPGRLHYVVSSGSAKDIGVDKFEDSCEVFPNLQEALESADEDHRVRDVFLIGGQGLFNQAMPYKNFCKNIFQTRIGQNVEGDVKVDKSLQDGFVLSEISQSYAENGLNYDFTRWINPKLFAECHQEFMHKVFTKANQEQQYLDLIREIIETGNEKRDRTGVGTRSLFGRTMRFDISQTFPLLTTKKVFWKGVVEELLWFLRGSTYGKELSNKGVHIWDGNGSREFLDKLGFKDRVEGDLGPVYGFQWRHFGAKYTTWDANYSGQGVDQIQDVIRRLKNDPDSRRHIVNAWNVADLSKMALPPCHVLFQFYVNDGKLSCMLYQRSCDVGLGIPFNIASYALLTVMIARVTFS